MNDGAASEAPFEGPPGEVAGDRGYPRFSAGELERRRSLLAGEMTRLGVDHLVVYGANRFGSAVGWLTGWPVTRQALVVFSEGERDLLLVEFYNHVPNAAALAPDADVRWAGPSLTTSAIKELRRRGAARDTVGILGPIGYRLHGGLVEAFGTVTDMGSEYARLRLRKSDEELEWLRKGVAFTDRAVEALRANLREGLSEHELADIVERAYVPEGGRTHIHYFGVTSMRNPTLGVPAQWTSGRRVAAGDVVTCELSASYWDYTGQILRTFAVAEDPPPLYRELHQIADAAFDSVVDRIRPGAMARDLVAAATAIEDAGFTTRDDLVHGFVGGYFPPILGSPSRQLTEIPELELEEGMTLVVQPNVVTPDETAGVQTGELVLVGAEGAVRLHSFERGLLRVA